MSYFSRVFDVVTFEQAKNIVLTPDPKDTEKFVKETNFLVEEIAKLNLITDSSTVLDFGCGMGRVSKKLIEEFNCKVYGTDISDSMLTFAKLNVANLKKFYPQKTYDIPSSIDVCLCILVLQHVENPQAEIDRIISVLKPNGYLILVNELKRFVPAGADRNGFVIWDDDGYDIIGQISSRLKKVNSVKYMSSNTEIGVYRKIETEGDKQSAAFLKDEYYDL